MISSSSSSSSSSPSLKPPTPPPPTRFFSIKLTTTTFLFITTLLLISAFFLLQTNTHPLFCSLPTSPNNNNPNKSSLPSDLQLLSTILHYATSPITPQQSLPEITLSFSVLRRRSPCNFLIFGLGHDSPMWSSFNPAGKTLFLEEDPKWFHSVLLNSPIPLHAHNILYPTHLSDADHLIQHYKSEPDCLPPRTHLKGNRRCKLALPDLPDEVYDTEWDVIMVDAPKGYFGEAPGRMGAIYSAAVMARGRKGEGVTDVFLHDVNRKVEKMYGMEFFCKKNLVAGVGRLWHFGIPPARKSNHTGLKGFC